MIGLSFEKPLKYGSANKATVHKNTGKLGFSASAAQMLELDRIKAFKIGTNLEDREDKNFYLIPSEESDKDSFRVNKAGQYYYINFKHILEKHRIDYRNNTIEFEIIESNENEKYFILRKKE